MNMHSLGWNGFFEASFNSLQDPELVPARVSCQHRDRYDILCEAGEYSATIAGRLRHLDDHRQYPAVGDWVAVKISSDGGQAVIQHVLTRRTAFTRRAVKSGGMPETGGKTEEQILAANLDTVFLVSGLDNDYNIRRLERYLSVAWDSGAKPVIVLNKVDLCDHLEGVLDEIAAVAIGVDVELVSAVTGQNMSALTRWVAPGETVGLLGSSGVGKSTIINFLLGEQRQATQGVRTGDQRGRHTTTSRELIQLPNGGCLLDTPGMRSFQPWSDEGGLSRTFEEIEALAAQCKFTDCTHTSEPGCAVLAALQNGEIDEGRWQNYRKMLREQAYLERRQDQRAMQVERDRWKAITKRMRDHPSKKRS